MEQEMNIPFHESIDNQHGVDYVNGNCSEAKVDKIKSDNPTNAKMLVKTV